MTTTLTTIRDVAQEAGVAVSTVSRVLNGSGYSSEDTRFKVLAASERLGYRPSAAARGLRRSRTMTIGVLMPDFSNPVRLLSLRGAEETAQRHGYVMLICDGQNSAAIQNAHLGRLFEHRVDGLLLGGPLQNPDAMQPFLDAGIPIAPEILSDQKSHTFRPVRSERHANAAAYRHLASLGHRRIAYVTRPIEIDAPSYSSRLRAYRRGLEAAGIALDPSLIVGANDRGECAAAVKRLLSGDRPPTAFIAGTHEVAAILLLAIYGAGLRIPEDASFVTYGDSIWVEAHRPPLCVIRHDYYAEAAAQVIDLVARMERRPERLALPQIEAEFIVRASCAPPPSATG